LRHPHEIHMPAPRRDPYKEPMLNRWSEIMTHTADHSKQLVMVFCGCLPFCDQLEQINCRCGELTASGITALSGSWIQRRTSGPGVGRTFDIPASTELLAQIVLITVGC
ncbi:hypothetical protein T10_8225, partial [Trichinella papuae]